MKWIADILIFGSAAAYIIALVYIIKKVLGHTVRAHYEIYKDSQDEK